MATSNQRNGSAAVTWKIVAVAAVAFIGTLLGLVYAANNATDAKQWEQIGKAKDSVVVHAMKPGHEGVMARVNGIKDQMDVQFQAVKEDVSEIKADVKELLRRSPGG